MKTMRLLLAAAIAVPLAAQQPDSTKAAGPPYGAMMGPGMVQGGMMPGGAQMMMGPMAGYMMQMMGMMGPMMRAMAFSPAHLLAHQEDLKLSKEQVTKLSALRDRFAAAHDSAFAVMQKHMNEMAPLLSTATPDTVKIKPHFDALQGGMTRAHWALLSASTQARAILTETQRARMEGWADAAQQMMPMAGRGMPMMGQKP
ncbi:MAG TPA: Spy/CpxP family protein refolding chaperone [Gemmatimonadales bacterium]|nr:Spy/CpxP family protein refolding chaperone [Gemmatimonadales bacterium]